MAVVVVLEAEVAVAVVAALEVEVEEAAVTTAVVVPVWERPSLWRPGVRSFSAVVGETCPGLAVALVVAAQNCLRAFRQWAPCGASLVGPRRCVWESFHPRLQRCRGGLCAVLVPQSGEEAAAVERGLVSR